MYGDDNCPENMQLVALGLWEGIHEGCLCKDGKHPDNYCKTS